MSGWDDGGAETRIGTYNGTRTGMRTGMRTEPHAGLQAGRGFEGGPGFSVEPGPLLAAARAAESIAAAFDAAQRRLIEAAESALRSELPGVESLAELLGDECRRVARFASAAQETARRLRASAERYVEVEERLTRAALGTARAH